MTLTFSLLLMLLFWIAWRFAWDVMMAAMESRNRSIERLVDERDAYLDFLLDVARNARGQ